jgi:peroxiredoxin Q/BCP
MHHINDMTGIRRWGAALSLLLVIGACSSAQTPRLNVGDTIPAFVLKDQDGRDFDIRDHLGKQILVIYFYPKDESAVCTKEACAFRDSMSAFTSAGAQVIGINSGSVASHKSFQDHHHLPFILLSDPDNKVLRQFGVGRSWGISGRETFVVGKEGRIISEYNSLLHGKAHAEKSLEAIRNYNHK